MVEISGVRLVRIDHYDIFCFGHEYKISFNCELFNIDSKWGL